ncbi:hypothetical protein BDZ89DRAFT_243785 [Hymenopellis radicata]|nr:hypothetical protein BDZ89DRAFT_243785 [Hymenopellis radicata]
MALSFIGKPISLSSHSDVRYRGILAGIDPAASTVQVHPPRTPAYALRGYVPKCPNFGTSVRRLFGYFRTDFGQGMVILEYFRTKFCPQPPAAYPHHSASMWRRV